MTPGQRLTANLVALRRHFDRYDELVHREAELTLHETHEAAQAIGITREILHRVVPDAILAHPAARAPALGPTEPEPEPAPPTLRLITNDTPPKDPA